MRSSSPDQNIEKKILNYFQGITEYQNADDLMQRNVRTYTEHTLKILKDVFSSFSFTSGDHTLKTHIMENYYSDLCNNFNKYRDAGKEYKLAKTYPLTQDQHIEAIANLTENQDLKSFLSSKIGSQAITDLPSVLTASHEFIRVESDLQSSTPASLESIIVESDLQSSTPASPRLTTGGEDLLSQLNKSKESLKKLREELKEMKVRFSTPPSSNSPSKTFVENVQDSRVIGNSNAHVPGR